MDLSGYYFRYSNSLLEVVSESVASCVGISPRRGALAWFAPGLSVIDHKPHHVAGRPRTAVWLSGSARPWRWLLVGSSNGCVALNGGRRPRRLGQSRGLHATLCRGRMGRWLVELCGAVGSPTRTGLRRIVPVVWCGTRCRAGRRRSMPRWGCGVARGRPVRSNPAVRPGCLFRVNG